MENTQDDAIAIVIKNLNKMQQEAIVNKFINYNPQLNGIECADVLFMLHQHDSDLQTVESFCRSNPQVSNLPGISEAIIALIWSDTPLTVDNAIALTQPSSE